MSFESCEDPVLCQGSSLLIFMADIDGHNEWRSFRKNSSPRSQIWQVSNFSRRSIHKLEKGHNRDSQVSIDNREK